MNVVNPTIAPMNPAVASHERVAADKLRARGEDPTAHAVAHELSAEPAPSTPGVYARWAVTYSDARGRRVDAKPGDRIDPSPADLDAFVRAGAVHVIPKPEEAK